MKDSWYVNKKRERKTKERKNMINEKEKKI